jgi:hypothetical protein
MDDISSPKLEIILHAAIMIRIWPGDAYGMTANHLTQWIMYMRYAGVLLFRVYDNCIVESECLSLTSEVDGVTIEYIRWPSDGTYATAQISMLEDSLRRSYNDEQQLKKTGNVWVLHLDVDEYPFMPSDMKCGFLLRAINNVTTTTDQLVMRTIFFGGQAIPEMQVGPTEPLITKYIYRLLYAESRNQRTKYMARASATINVQHYNIVHDLSVSSQYADPTVLRVNHYWGPRLNRTFEELIKDDSIIQIAVLLGLTGTL